MRNNYEKGGYGYGHAKQALYELILEKFEKERARFQYLMQNQTELEEALALGAKKAVKVAHAVIQRVRTKSGTSN